MQSEWRRDQERLKKSRTLRAATRHRLKGCEASLSKLKQSLTDVRSQLQHAAGGLTESYALLDRAEQISKRVGRAHG